MAEKRITTVDEVRTVDESADYLLIVRGTQKDLKRLLIRRLPQDFDIHDDVADELTTLAGVDRLLISDEGSLGAPQKFVKLSTLRSFFLDLFDLHDDVPVELTEADGQDRLLISDEDEPGDPQKWISAENLRAYMAAVPGVMKYEVLPTEYAYGDSFVANNVSHTLGKPPVHCSPVLVCKVAEQGYVPGDEVYVSWWQKAPQSQSNYFGTLAIFAATDTHVSASLSMTSTNNADNIDIPRKTTSNYGVRFTPTAGRWKVKLMIAG